MRVSAVPSSVRPAASPNDSEENLEDFAERADNSKYRYTIPESLSLHPYTENPFEEKASLSPKELYFEDLIVPEHEDSRYDRDRCGIWCFKPEFLQPFKNMKSFLVVFIIVGMCQGMFHSYWPMTLSSIEKRFQLSSQTTGILTTVNDVTHLSTVLFVAHFCGKGHRPRYMAIASMIVGISFLVFAMPELFASKWGESISTTVIEVGNSSETQMNSETCLNAEEAERSNSSTKCDAGSHSNRNDNFWPFFFLVLAQSLLGIGTTAPIVLAMPFIDDNVKIQNAPVYFSLGLAGRLLGPVFGVLLGGFCLDTYVDLTPQNISSTDPRWMGAWWLGFVIMGCLLCMAAMLYLCFPRSLSRQDAHRRERLRIQKKTQNLTSNSGSSFRKKLGEGPKDVKRLLTNKIFVTRLINDCIDMLVVSGYFSFAVKYIEFHFRLSPAAAGRTSGLSSILAMGLGVAVGGVITRKLKLQPKQVALSLLASSILTATCYFCLAMVTCEPRHLVSHWDDNNMLNVDTQCSNGCHCERTPYSPVCHEELQFNYYSACHAGCPESISINDTKYFTECRCLTANVSTLPSWGSSHPGPPVGLRYNTSSPFEESGQPTVKRGFCEEGCSVWWYYVIISASFKFLSMIPFAGSAMLSFRIVDPDLKALSKGMQTFCASLFAFIPGPIIMGVLIDSTCKLWNTDECGEKGACLVYDLDAFRLKMHLYIAVIKLIACFLDVFIYYSVRNMKFDRETDGEMVTQNVLTKNMGSVKDLTSLAVTS